MPKQKRTNKRKTSLGVYAILLMVVIGTCFFLSATTIGGFLSDHFLLSQDTSDTGSQSDPLLILVNRKNPLPDSYTPPLTELYDVQVHEAIRAPLTEMLSAAEEDGIGLVINSAYRTREEQQEELDAKIATYRAKGLFYFTARKKAEREVQRPGESEHQTGLAVDLGNAANTDVDTAYQWLAAHAAEYGFILRYPIGKTTVTGINYEPWHYRYVGVGVAQAITRAEITLEEYLEETSSQ